MSDTFLRPEHKRFDQLAKRLDLYTDRLSIGATVVAIPIFYAKVPHYQAFVLAAFVVLALSIVVSLLIKMAQLLGLVSPKALAEKPKPHLFDHADIPGPKIVPIVCNVAQDDRAGRSHADEVARIHEVRVAGTKVKYWYTERHHIG